ncbi:hypothetical protein EGJ52_23185 [Pseudomonas luteola]|uniref:hypothetical protein n=1 Tax=Pseudomonas luteola TaxID=47886 RepID=UPI000F76DE7E|nr:hypothetical protein [Pseudomonas luteola]RRW39955.1 hypothetical protein EGJ52_23185 [Pseudomonas luteola]
MKKKLQLALNKYQPIPLTLQGANAQSAKTVIDLDLAALYHHYYLDTYGIQPPSPDPAQFEHMRFLTPHDDLRFQGAGVGASTNAKRGKSSEMGQAFCRWFLYEHVEITYFAHLDGLIDKPSNKFHEFTVKRSAQGDIPDYLCSDKAGSVVLAEAKGRYTPVGFHTEDFERWRKQFTRIQVLDAKNEAVRVKGHIVATRFATESKPRVQTKLFAEDPSTEGREPISGETARSLSRQIIGSHYGNVLMKIDQPHLALAIRSSSRLELQSEIQVAVWKFAFEDQQRYFAGGYYAKYTKWPSVDLDTWLSMHRRWDPWLSMHRRWDPSRLGIHSGTFVGVELSVFEHLVKVARGDERLLDYLPEVEPVRELYSGLSMLRDGSVIGPLSMFIPVRFARY